MLPYISVLVPCFNGEKFINRCIQSVYEQEYPNIQLIVVDDGSTDHSREKVQNWTGRFADSGYRLDYLYQDNQGPGGAINTGLKQVVGTFLTLLDADDMLLPGSLKERAEFLEAHPDFGAVRTNGWIEKGEHRRLFTVDSQEKEIEDVFNALLRGKTYNWAGSYMLRTEILFSFYPDRNIYTSRYGQNLQLLLPVTYQRKCGYIDKPLMSYIQQPDSLSQVSDSSEAAQKELINAKGYLDIRLRMIQSIVADDFQAMLLEKDVTSDFFRYAMRVSWNANDQEKVRSYYRQLKKITKLQLDDRILYYKKEHPLWAFLLRVVRRMNAICGRKSA